MTPLALEGDVAGANVVDVNPVHSLLAFGTEGNNGGGAVQFWDPRSRSVVGVLNMPWTRLGLGDITAIASRTDGLSYAVGTSTGHTLLYDIRTSKPSAMKDQGYGLPMKNVAWIQGGSRMAGDGMVISADSKVIKIWDRETVCACAWRSLLPS
jgi:ribosome biogenesis protein ENP2